MYFSTFSDFIAMGGHGLYVWMAFLFTIFCMSFLLISPIIKKRSTINSVRHQMQLEKIRTKKDIDV